MTIEVLCGMVLQVDTLGICKMTTMIQKAVGVQHIKQIIIPKKNKIRIQKESWHVNYDMRAEVNAGDNFNALKKRGIKHVSFVFERNGKLGRRIESWIDLNGIDTSNNKPKNKWKLMRLEEDHPDLEDWGDSMRLCNCASDHQIILWAAPLVTYRWDFSRIKLSHGTVQEINPPIDGNFHQLGKVIEE